MNQGQSVMLLVVQECERGAGCTRNSLYLYFCREEQYQ